MIDPVMNGAYRLDILEDQYDSDAGGNIIRSTIVPWDITVFVAGTPRIGRVYSFAWAFNTGSFDQSASTNASFYARVPGGDSESFAVMELRTDGLAGFIFEIQGNSTGVRGRDAGRSVPEVGHSAANEYQIYLNPPTTRPTPTSRRPCATSPSAAGWRRRGRRDLRRVRGRLLHGRVLLRLERRGLLPPRLRSERRRSLRHRRRRRLP
ncbi:MAG: hypothetical protein M5U28_47165 [Sandaracinaceae bacterium]|nr:hypothetical protein [Sandaracinaceae bacterium]